MILNVQKKSEPNTLQGHSYQGQVHCWGRRSEIEIMKFEDRPLHVRRKWVSKLCIGHCQPHEPGRSYEDTGKHYVLKEYVYQIKTHWAIAKQINNLGGAWVTYGFLFPIKRTAISPLQGMVGKSRIRFGFGGRLLSRYVVTNSLWPVIHMRVSNISGSKPSEKKNASSMWT